MRHAVLALAHLSALLVGPQTVLADTAQRASACYGVADPDARAYCLAKAHGERGLCYSIQRADLRQECIAEVGR